jgi:hypothetical protein
MNTTDTVANIYTQTAALYAEIAPQLNDAARGYKVLYGPPLVRAPVFFLGLQVGDVDGGPEQGEREGERIHPPHVTEYATASWRLARKLQEIFKVDFLKTTTGSNANFFRCANDEDYREKVALALRERCEQFSRRSVQNLVQIINPERIIVIAFRTLEKLKWGEFQFVAPGVKRGTLWGRPALAVWHLSSMHATREQRIVIYQELRAFAGV